jgi:hypothetical protein
MANKQDVLDGELQNFKFILTQVEPEMRTEEQCLGVIKYLQSTEYLSKGDPLAFIELARNLIVKTFKEGQVICKEGELGDEVYYILKGKVAGASIIK